MVALFLRPVMVCAATVALMGAAVSLANARCATISTMKILVGRQGNESSGDKIFITCSVPRHGNQNYGGGMFITCSVPCPGSENSDGGICITCSAHDDSKVKLARRKSLPRRSP